MIFFYVSFLRPHLLCIVWLWIQYITRTIIVYRSVDVIIIIIASQKRYGEGGFITSKHSSCTFSLVLSSRIWNHKKKTYEPRNVYKTTNNVAIFDRKKYMLLSGIPDDSWNDVLMAINPLKSMSNISLPSWSRLGGLSHLLSKWRVEGVAEFWAHK